MELLIAVAIIGIVLVMGVPYYQDYSRRSYYAEITAAGSSYKIGVNECFSQQGTVAGCNGGTNGIQANQTSTIGAIASIVTLNGVITITPAVQNGLVASDTYIMTPTAGAGGAALTWVVGGGGVDKGYAR